MPLTTPPITSTPNGPLPALLRMPPYRSVLRRGSGARQLGLDPATALAVDDLPPALAVMLDELTDPVGADTLVARAAGRGGDPGEARDLLRALVASGAVIDADVPDRRERHRAGCVVVVSGDGPLALGIVVGLVRAGVGTVHTETTDTVLAEDLGTGYLDADRGRDRRAAAVAAVRRLCPAAGTGPPPLRLEPDLVVLADVVAPDPDRVAGLHVTGTAHLPVRLRDGVGVVGPLVLPARTACLSCMDLHRLHLDPGWPGVVAQLVGRRGHADPACTVATAALGTAQAIAALDSASTGGCAPPTLDAVLELDPTAGTLVRRVWPAHAGCGCGAAGAHGGVGHVRATCGMGRGGDTIVG